MYKLRYCLVTVAVGCALATNVQAESPYDIWAYRYTYYGYRDTELAMRDPVVPVPNCRALWQAESMHSASKVRPK